MRGCTVTGKNPQDKQRFPDAGKTRSLNYLFEFMCGRFVLTDTQNISYSIFHRFYGQDRIWYPLWKVTAGSGSL
jgi:hypothetical protein